MNNLSFDNCLIGAHRSAGAAVNTFVGIDFVNGIAFADRLNRAFRLAYAAGDTFVCNLVSHDQLLMFSGSNFL